MTHASTVATTSFSLPKDQPDSGRAPRSAVEIGRARQPAWLSAPDWNGAVHEGLRALGLLAIVVLFVLTVIPMALQSPMDHLACRVGLSLLATQLLVVGFALLTRMRNPRLVTVLLALLVVSLALMVPFRAALLPNDVWSPGMWAVPLQVLAMMSLGRASYRRHVIAALVAMTCVELAGPFFWPFTLERLMDSLIILEPVATLQIFANGLLAMARQHDREAAKAHRARASQLEQTAQTEGRREAARVLHDHVLHALHAIGEDRSLASTQQAVDECRSTLERIARPPAVARMVQVQDLVREDPVVGRIGAEVVGEGGPLPATVATTLAAAAHEALTNAERHSGADSVRVEVSSTAGGAKLVITDDGRGFDPDRPNRGRLGLRRSIHERMHDIGGSALVASVLGQGTVVTLQWPADEATRRTEPDSQWERVDARRFIILAALPSLVTTVVMMVLLAPRGPADLPALLLTCVMVTLGLWEVARPSQHAMSQARAAVLLSIAMASWVAVLVTAPHHELMVYQLYSAWGLTATVQIVVAHRPKIFSQLLCWALVVVLVVGTLARYSLYDAWNHQNGAAAAGVIVFIGLRALWIAQDISAESEEHRRQLQQVHLDVARMHTLERLDQFWSDRVTEDALPLIKGVAQGTADPSDDQVRALARMTESLVRDELMLGPGQRTLSEQLHHLRIDGWVVQSSLSREDGAPVLDAAARLVGVLGPAEVPGQVVTLSGSGDGVNAVVLDVPAEQAARWQRKIVPLGGMMDTDPDFVRLSLVAR